jgi:8-oxo-dGTP diphosphatase
MDYVCGFLFNTSRRGVVLIEKQKPAWQKGKLNGVGGKIENGEVPSDAMVREFKEEAGASVSTWKLFRTEKFPTGVKVHFFTAVATEAQWSAVRTAESERIIKWYGGYEDSALMYNLKYLLPMARVLLNQPAENTPEP